MSRSKKKKPFFTYTSHTQKAGKVKANKRFRRLVKVRLRVGSTNLPLKSIEVTSPYDLGGDGKHFWKDADEKAMQSPDLRQYEDIFRYMLDHNCKVEQESVKAIALL